MMSAGGKKNTLGTCWLAGQYHQSVLAGRYPAGVVPPSRMNRRKAPSVGQ